VIFGIQHTFDHIWKVHKIMHKALAAETALRLARPAPHALGSPGMLPMKAEAPYQHVLVQA
jgi:hypothetical protein